MKTKFPLGPIGLALVVLFSYSKVHTWQVKETERLRAKIAEVRAEQQLQAEVAGLLEQAEHYRGQLLEQGDSSWLTQRLIALGKESGVQFDSIDQESPQQLPHFSRFSVNLSFRASYHQLGALLDKIEKSVPFLYPERVMATAGPDGEPASIQLRVSTAHSPAPLS